MKFAIGIDLGGTKISGVLMDESGRVHNKYMRLTEAHKSKEEILDNLLEVIISLRKPGVECVGIGFPGFCDEKGRIVFAPNVQSFQGLHLKQQIENRTGLKAVVENDARC